MIGSETSRRRSFLQFLVRIGFVGCIGILLIADRAQATSINDPGNGDVIYDWGPSSLSNQSYGVVFTAPQAYLDDFSLTVDSADTNFPFESQVYAWNGTTTVGPALYTSGVQDTTTTMMTYTWDPDITLTTGDEYIAFVTNQPFGSTLGGSGDGQIAAGSGLFEFAEGAPAGGFWQTYTENAEFQADFSATAPSSAVPEPSSVILPLTVLLAAALVLRKRIAPGI
jgi:hypothetical protein